jgi:hypothetical protein
MSRPRQPGTILTVAIALVVLVQVAAAVPVCRCAGTDAPCQVPEPTEPRRCCEDPAPATGCATGMSIGCCEDVVAEPGDAFVLPADPGVALQVPVPAASVLDPTPAPAEFLAPAAGPDLPSGAPVYLRHAALLI